MINLDELKRSAEDAIRGAFPAGVAPAEDEMRNDHCPECRGTAARFAGKSWPDIGVDDLRENPAAGLLTAAGFRYYLPAMMLRSLEATRELDCLPSSVIGELSPPGGKVNRREAERLGGFTPEQVKAIIAFLLYFETLERVDRSEPDWPEDAILSMPVDRRVVRAIKYWTKQLSHDAA